MNKYIPDKLTVDAWLLNGGAEIVLEVIRWKGWTVEVLTGDDWEWLPDIVVAAECANNTISVNGAKSPYLQAVFAVMIVEDVKPADFNSGWRNWEYPVLYEHDKFYEWDISASIRFCDDIRLSSEATISLIGKAVEAK